jgi:7-keto-8-aminopelargonate synthetase-like enzyme
MKTTQRRIVHCLPVGTVAVSVGTAVAVLLVWIVGTSIGPVWVVATASACAAAAACALRLDSFSENGGLIEKLASEVDRILLGNIERSSNLPEKEIQQIAVMSREQVQTTREIAMALSERGGILVAARSHSNTPTLHDEIRRDGMKRAGPNAK